MVQAREGSRLDAIGRDWTRLDAIGRDWTRLDAISHSGLIACQQCGCSIVGEIKKQKYVYYHCTGYADKCRGDPATCRRRYVREEVLEQQFTDLLGRLQFDDEVLEWVREALYASHVDERREHEDAIKRLQAERKRIGDRINAMYLDKLDGRVDGAFFDKMSAEWSEEQNRCLHEIEHHQSAEQSYMDEGVQVLELARNAQRLFALQAPREKRRLLDFVLSNCTWEDGEVVSTFRQPFDLLAETTAIAARANIGNSANFSKNEIWLPFLNTYRTMCLAPRADFRRILEDVGAMQKRPEDHGSCAIKNKCTTGKERRIARWEHEHLLDAVQKRLNEHPEKMRQRRETVEHPFGTIKARMGATHFLMKTELKRRSHALPS